MNPKANSDQLEFDGVFVFSQAKQQLTIQDVAAGLAISDDQVRLLLETGELVYASISLAPQSDRQRDHKRIARFSAVAWYRERLAEAGNDSVPYFESPEVKFWRQNLRQRKEPKS